MKKKPVHDDQPFLFNLEEIDPDQKQTKQSSQKTHQHDYVFDFLDVLLSPALTFEMSWADLIPSRLFDVLPIARMKALKQHEELATYVECAIYMYTRSHEAPMDYEWAEIYLHVSCKTAEEWFGEDRWDIIQAPKELSQYLQSQLDGLRRHIYKKRREILKSRLKQEKQHGEEPVASAVSSDPRQQSLFADYIIHH